MNSIRKLVKNIIGNSKWCRRRCYRSGTIKNYPNRAIYHFKYNISPFITSSVIAHAKFSVEEDLERAIEEGETAIIELMDELSDLVITVSEEYRACLAKQIDLIKKLGDDAFDELPQFRTVATELSDELNEYVILLKTIGEIAYEQTVLSMMMDKNQLKTVLRKYKELEILLLKEFEENKRKELELLEANIANILL